MAHIFISYSRRDIDFAGKIVEALAGNNIDTWIDWKSIPKGEYWEQEIYRGIEEADAFLFLISPDSVRSQMCNKEIAHAVDNSKRILPIVIRDAETANFEAELPRQEISKRNWIFCRDGQDNFVTAIGETLKTIHANYEWLKYHTRLQVQALEWERNQHEKSFLLHGKELQDAEFQLATNTPKEPHPTDLQREYVLKSRQVADRQRVRITSVAITTIVVLSVLALVAMIQSGIARQAQATAETNASIAQTAQVRAEEQAKIALARQLAAQAEFINTTQSSKQLIAVLLATQSMNLYPSSEAAEFLLNDNFAAHSISRMTHNGRVLSVAFSPNGKYIVSENEDGAARVSEAQTGKEISHMIYDDGDVLSVAFSPNGKYLVSRIQDATVRIWETETGKEINRMVYEGYISSVAISPDGRYVVLSSCDSYDYSKNICVMGTARVREVNTGKEIARMTHDRTVFSVAFSWDSKYVVTGSDGSARVWRTTTGKEITRITDDSTVFSVAFSPDSRYVVSGSNDGTARVWEAMSGKEIARMTHDSAVSSVAFSPDSRYVVSGSDDGSVRVWEFITGKDKVITRMTHEDTVSSVGFSPDSRYAISGSYDGTTRVWELETGKEITRLNHNDRVISVAFSPKDRYVALGSDDGSVRVWEVTTGKEIAVMRHAAETAVWAVAFSPDGKYVVSGGYDGTIRLWVIKTGKEIALMGHNGPVYSVAFSSDGKYIVSGGGDGTVRVWEVETNKEIVRLTYQEGIVLWGTDAGWQGYLAQAHKGEVAVWGVAFSPDGKYIVSGSDDSTVRVLEVATGKEIARMAHESWVSSVAFSPDSKYIVSGGEDKTVRVWEAATGNEVARLTHEDMVWSVAFSPDGRYVISGSADKSASVWIYRSEDLIANTCSRLTRNLTRAEWKEYIGDALPYQAICPNLPIPDSSLTEIVLEEISKIDNPARVQMAIDKISELLQHDETISNPTDKARQVVFDVIHRQISEISEYNLMPEDFRQVLALFEDAKVMGVAIDPLILNSVCWEGSTFGHAQDVLPYCDQAVQLAPDDENIRDSRGLARALTNDYAGAVEDFQFFVENSSYQDSIRQRQEWITDLKKGKNPFTPEVLEQL